MLENGALIAGRYEIAERIGTGGMSDVYLATDHSLGRAVAIKVLKEEFAADVAFVTRFRAEAQAAAGLEHPNIVNIYDVGSEDGRYYIVMEYVEGITLKTYITKKGALNYNELLSIAIQVGRGIEAAHNKNIVHRDIKPQNVIISKEGKVKVTDFGIAKAVTSNTINADRMGSVHYASPEQARNGEATFQSDIYSLGIVMYEACTGKLPFDGDTTVAIALQHLQTEITPPSVYVPDVPISVEKIILRATLKNPSRRYASITEMLIDMKKALVNPHEDFVIIPIQEEPLKRPLTPTEAERISRQAGLEEEEPFAPKRRRRPVEPEEEYEEDEYEYEDDDDDDDDVNPRMRKTIRILTIVAAIIIVVIVVYLIGSFLGLFRFGGFDRTVTTSQEAAEMKEVPDVLGKTRSEAEAVLTQAGFKMEVAGEASSDVYDEGQVMQQAPGAKTKVAVGSTVSVTISNGVGEISIPDVKGMNENDAISILEQEGFRFSRRYEESATVPQGQIISQSPDGNSMGKSGDTITIVVSRGVGTVRVPNVVNKPQAQAASELSAAGLSVGGITQEHSDSIAAGNVINQSISAGSVVDSGSTVDLVISSGAQVELYKLSGKQVNPIGENGTYIVLLDGNGEAILSQTITGPVAINASNLTTPTGTIVYYDDIDRSIELQREQVQFERQ